MIKINNKTVKVGHFPDGTLFLPNHNDEDFFIFNFAYSYGPVFEIDWYYESDAELFALVCIVKHIRDHLKNAVIYLYLPYIPHARMDRVKCSGDVFTLKYFSDIINSLNFDFVDVLDPHSYVSTALLDRVRVCNVNMFIERVVTKITGNDNLKCDNLALFYPDEGAKKRYELKTDMFILCGEKKRDWNTGKITSLEISGEVPSVPFDVLIIDDICSYGGTFVRASKALREKGANKVYLYVTHCENSILKGELLNGYIDRVFTTNSIFTETHSLIEVFEC